ncbi:hypothetical protein CRYUN_Cryun34aG0062500 [Craigia yunnanensis]
MVQGRGYFGKGLKLFIVTFIYLSKSCRKLLELMILDRHQEDASGGGLPAHLATLLGSSCRKSKMVCCKHFFANATTTFLL